MIGRIVISSFKNCWKELHNENEKSEYGISIFPFEFHAQVTERKEGRIRINDFNIFFPITHTHTHTHTHIYIYICIYYCGVLPTRLVHTQQGTNYTATCLPSRKLSKLDEPDMQDTAGEAGRAYKLSREKRRRLGLMILITFFE